MQSYPPLAQHLVDEMRARAAAEPARAGTSYDIQHVVFEVHRRDGDRRELWRAAAPCSGPFTNAPVTNRLLAGEFTLTVEAVTNGTGHAAWPLPETEVSRLPSALRLSLVLPDHEPLQTEALIHAASGISSPLPPRNPTEP